MRYPLRAGSNPAQMFKASSMQEVEAVCENVDSKSIPVADGATALTEPSSNLGRMWEYGNLCPAGQMVKATAF